MTAINGIVKTICETYGCKAAIDMFGSKVTIEPVKRELTMENFNTIQQAMSMYGFDVAYDNSKFHAKTENSGLKKLFISCPMRGRTDEAIESTREQMHKIAEAVFNQKLEVVDSFFVGANERKVPENCMQPAIFWLGESIIELSLADYYIGIADQADFPHFNGCYAENCVADLYGGLKTYLVDPHYVCPDIIMEDIEGE